MTLYILGKFAGTKIGGAEISSEELAKQISNEKIEYIRLSNSQKFRGYNTPHKIRDKIFKYPNLYFLNFFSVYFAPVYAYIIFNFYNPEEKINLKKNDIVLGIGIECIPILLNLNCKTLFIARSLTDIGETPIYGFNLLKIKRMIKFLIDYLPASFYKILLKKYINSSKDFGVNSKFMKKKVVGIFKCKPSKIKIFEPNPQIKKELIEEIKNKSTKNKKIKVILVGDVEGKGIDLFKKIAKKLRSSEKYIFICISRNAKHRNYCKINNIYYEKWGKFFNIVDKKSIILILSLWQESYCRVAKECSILNLPLVAFRKGGIPEASQGNKKAILLDHSRDIEQWIIAINKQSYRLGYKN